MAEGAWKKVGDVMGAAGGTQATSGKTLHDGKVRSLNEHNLIYFYNLKIET